MQGAPWEAQKGPLIDYAMLGIVKEFGNTDDTVEALAETTSTRTHSVKQRLESLLAVPPKDDERGCQE